MKNLLYIGNKLSQKNKTVSTIDTLGIALEAEGFTINYASSYSNKLLRFVHMLSSVIRQRNSVDYVLIDTYSTLNFYYAFGVSFLCEIFKLKHIPILHGGNLPARLKNNPKLSTIIFKKSYVNVSPSYYTEKHFKDFGYSNIVCIPNTIELEKYTFSQRNIEEVKLLWVRSFSQIYNPKLAVDILAELERRGYKAYLTMVGPEKDGSLKETQLYAKSLNVKVEFTGKLSKKEWITKSNDYNIFINTTNFDNMPVSVIEAMALGLPIISTNVGGLPFLITHNVDGVLVPPNKTDNFVNEIIKLKNNKKHLHNITMNAREKAENYDWNKVKYKWMKVLK